MHEVFFWKIRLSPETQIYGIRRYLRGAWLSLHVDQLPTHILSAILQVRTNFTLHQNSLIFTKCWHSIENQEFS